MQVKAPAAPGPHWRASTFDQRKLQSSPVFLPKSPGRVQPLPKSPRRERELSALAALQAFTRSEIARLPHNSPERMEVARHIFSELIATLPAHGPLLAEVKQQYESVLEAKAGTALLGKSEGQSKPTSPRSPTSSRPLRSLPPLQLPAAYYESQWRQVQAELELARMQGTRALNLARATRNACLNASTTLHVAGMRPVTPATPSDTMPQYGTACDATSPLEMLASITEALEDAVDVELATLQERLQMLQMRSMSAGQTVARASCSSTTAVGMVEDLIDQANEEAKLLAAEPGAARRVAERSEALRALHKVLLTQEMDIKAVSTLLTPGWELPTLRKFITSID